MNNIDITQKRFEIIKGIIDEELRKTGGQINIYIQNLDEDLAKMYKGKFKYTYCKWYALKQVPETDIPILYEITHVQFIKGEPAYHVLAYYHGTYLKYRLEHLDILEEQFDRLLKEHNYIEVEYGNSGINTVLGYCPYID